MANFRGLQVKRLRVRELLPEYGDRVTTITVEEAQELNFEKMVTVLPDGTVVHTWDELLESIQKIHQEEVELVRFAPLAGG